jgi:O-antigen ligase
VKSEDPPRPLTRSPGTGLRVLLFVAAVSAGLLLLSVAFPPGAADRLPVLLIALVLALSAAGRGDRGLVAFSFLFPCAGLLARLFGGSHPLAWPLLLFAGFAAGWSFRFVYDFESEAEPSAADPWLKALAAVWVLSGVVAVARARTLWALWHGLSGRVANGAGLPDVVAVRESILALCTMCSGAAFFFLLRRSSAPARRRAVHAALYGVTVAAAASLLQRTGVVPPEPNAFWRMTGRLSGGAADPNSLGLLCALGLVFSVVALVQAQRRALLALLSCVFLAGLFLSGSRSAFLLLLFALGTLLVASGVPGRLRLAATMGAAAAILAAAVLVSTPPGSLGQRLAETFDPATPWTHRISSRSLLWSCAASLLAADPFSGAGMGAFSWRLPDVLAERGTSFPARDNPGSAYVQAAAELGVPGLLLTLALAWSLGRAAARQLPELDRDPAAAGAAASVVAFLLALAFGSHWFAPDVSLLFFLLASIAAGPGTAGRASRAAGLLRALCVGVYAVAATVAALATSHPAETFRYAPRIGFYAREGAEGEAFCWTRRHFALWLPKGQERRLTLAQFAPLDDRVGVKAEAEGQLVYQSALGAGDAVALKLSAPADRARAIVFRLDRTFSPKRLGLSQDRRDLGLQVPLSAGQTGP